MNIYLSGKTNKSYLMLNGVEFELPSGEKTVVGSDAVSYYLGDDDDIEITLKGCFEFDMNEEGILRYFMFDDADIINDSAMIAMYFDEDSPVDYELEIEKFWAY